jgi:predicted MPP superfamily phosphohydrolase
MAKKFKKIILWLGALTIVFLVYAHFETYWIQVMPTTISSDSLPPEFSGKKIVFIADTHCGDNFEPARLGKVVDRINSLKPDIVLLGGDYVNRNGKYTTACFGEMAKIEAPLGKFGILGNHDVEAKAASVENAMRVAGITPLVNENRKISIGGSVITIAGTDETWYGKPDGAKAMKNASPFAVYLTHDPWYLEQYRPAAQLLLAGHTHGGQVTLFGIPFASIIFHHKIKYEKGIFFENGRTIIVTNGIGATILPLRFFARPQINLITLERSN